MRVFIRSLCLKKEGKQSQTESNDDCITNSAGLVSEHDFPKKDITFAEKDGLVSTVEQLTIYFLDKKILQTKSQRTIDKPHGKSTVWTCMHVYM